MSSNPKKIILTGDRPTGRLHLGHYLGTLKNRVKLQYDYQCYFIIADLHTLTTAPTKEKINSLKDNIQQLVLDYLSVGIDPKHSVIYLQSLIPEVTYLFTLFNMFVTVSRAQRIPTLKEVMHDSHITQPSMGLLSYPILQSADILMVKANLVPVGKDQTSHLEITREIAQTFNKNYSEVFPLPETLIGEVGTLPGIDGASKMSKSAGNCIYLSDTSEEVRQKVKSMYTDPNRLRATDPGKVEGNPVFIYHDAFNPSKEEVVDLKNRYRLGKVGDVEVKEKLYQALENFLMPIREQRQKFAANPDLISDIIQIGSQKTRLLAQQTLEQVQNAMGLTF